MENIILLVHLIAAVSIVVLILLQQGKGAEMGASFGSGASQTLFGSGGTGNFFSRLTAFFALIFFVTSFSLAVVAKQQTTVDDDLIPALEEVDLPALSETVESDIPEASAESDVPAAAVEESLPETATESVEAEMPAVDTEVTE